MIDYPLEQRQQDYADWCRLVRDPAQQNTEGVRAITFGKAVIEYQIAPLSEGYFALTYHLSQPNSGQNSAWEVYVTRKDCILALLRAARQFFGNGNWPGMLELIRTDSLFGWVEPDVDPERTRYHAMILATVKAHLHSPTTV